MAPDHVSHNLAFAQGIQKQLVKSAKSLMTKSALNPRIPERILFDPRRTDELAALGKSIFARTYKQPNPLEGILNMGMTGYGQVRGLHAERLAHITELAGLRKAMQRMSPGTPEHNRLATYIDDKMNAFKSSQRQRLAEVGAIAEPRQKFLHTTLPVTAAGGAALAGGLALGNVHGTASSQQDISAAPFADRLSYLLHPNNIPRRPAPPAPADLQSSATDTGSI